MFIHSETRPEAQPCAPHDHPYVLQVVCGARAGVRHKQHHGLDHRALQTVSLTPMIIFATVFPIRRLLGSGSTS